MGMRYYNRELHNSLELSANTEVAYYWVEGDRIQYWNFDDDSWLPYTGSLPLQEVCDALNAYTREHYSHEFREHYDQVNRNNPSNGIQCHLIRGGPLDGKCVISHYVLPMEVVDVLGLTVTERVSLPPHDLWELVLEPCGDTRIYLVGGGKYTVWYAGEYVLTKRADMAVGEVVCTDTVEYCRAIEGHLKAAYRAGIVHVSTKVKDLLTRC